MTEKRPVILTHGHGERGGEVRESGSFTHCGKGIAFYSTSNLKLLSSGRKVT